MFIHIPDVKEFVHETEAIFFTHGDPLNDFLALLKALEIVDASLRGGPLGEGPSHAQKDKTEWSGCCC